MSAVTDKKPRLTTSAMIAVVLMAEGEVSPPTERAWREGAAPPCDTLRASWLVEGNGDVIFVGGSRVPNEYITPLTTVARWSPTNSMA